MPPTKLPARASLENLKKQAKTLLKRVRSGEPSALDRVSHCFAASVPIGLSRAQFVIARENGFDSWRSMAESVTASSNTLKLYSKLRAIAKETGSRTWRRTATVIAVDLSWSLRESLSAAKHAVTSLDNVVRRLFPQNSHYVVGFSAVARQLNRRKLNELVVVDNGLLGTNMEHALLLGERLLSRHSRIGKQMFLLSDGEPTAHMQDGRPVFAYPPIKDTLRATYRAVARCKQKRIVVNMFVMELDNDARERWAAFTNRVADISGGYVCPMPVGETKRLLLSNYLKGTKLDTSVQREIVEAAMAC